MHVIAHYRITDPNRFGARAELSMPNRPAHWRLITSAPTRDGSACFELWWADSGAALQRLLRPAVASAGSVDCHEVDDENAMGLAEQPLTIINIPRRR